MLCQMKEHHCGQTQSSLTDVSTTSIPSQIYALMQTNIPSPKLIARVCKASTHSSWHGHSSACPGHKANNQGALAAMWMIHSLPS